MHKACASACDDPWRINGACVATIHRNPILSWHNRLEFLSLDKSPRHVDVVYLLLALETNLNTFCVMSQMTSRLKIAGIFYAHHLRVRSGRVLPAGRCKISASLSRLHHCKMSRNDTFGSDADVQ